MKRLSSLMQRKWRETDRWRRSDLYGAEEEEEEEEGVEEEQRRHQLRRKSEPCGVQLLPASERKRKELLQRRRRKSCDGQEGASLLAWNQEASGVTMMMRRRCTGGGRSDPLGPLLDDASKPGLLALMLTTQTASALLTWIFLNWLRLVSRETNQVGLDLIESATPPSLFLLIGQGMTLTSSSTFLSAEVALG